ncbi:alpha-ribazole phosphatase family protein [Aureibacter tunicatorum]|uniref:Alpha-ribazole phosphatase n=1 Tax=Aureibacter tunicatorum TaxID=866807 RepID=A0AAE3XPB3_9BACT|nr:alpha-ribazole phosphatase family protein [Aureibacter tunicatorum]MDR6239633.1 alpha-ribazole phosphatase [Aureibacter tunicatorum]BDD04109.1 phosphoglycerate mutase [Aureibacter tunicatorum]
MEIYLIRHTEPDIKKGICYGQTEVPLVSEYKSHIKEVIAKLPEEFDAIISSPWNRCNLLANELTTLKFCTDFRLSELNFGEWEMKFWDDVPKDWYEDFVNNKCEGGESYNDLRVRVEEIWLEILEKNGKDDKVAIVTHASVIRAIVSKVLKINLIDSFNFDISYGSVTKITSSGEFEKVNYLNL